MDFAERKKQEMEDYLTQKLTFSAPKNILEYSELTKDVQVDGETKKIWTDAFKAALKENEHIHIPCGDYYLDDTIVLSSNRKITADSNAFICLVKGTKVVMFRNADVIDGSRRLVNIGEPHTENVVIEGGIWGTEESGRAMYGAVGAFDNEDSLHGVHALLFFSGVKNLWVKNVTIRNTSCFALQIGRTENFLIENVTLENCYGDGVHLNGETHNGVVFNVKGHTRDDLVALNAYDWDNSTINNGSMEDITISKVFSAGGCRCMRILSGVTREEMGSIDCYIKNIHISHITGVQTFKLYLQTPSYIGEPDGTQVGRIENITFENIEIEKTMPSDSAKNYIEKDPITGHFGAFEINSNISKITLRDINYELNMPEYENTAHFITIGPKSCYNQEKRIEAFDPYVSSETEEIAYENITVNGKEVNDLCDHIKVIKFENLYPSVYASGNGRINKVKKLN